MSAIATGILEMPAGAYHADPCERPSLSASIARILCTNSPAHARAAHPKLNPAFERQDEQHFDIGTVAHALLLEGEAAIEVVDASDWRTNAAKEARDQARADGRTPLLEKHWTQVQAMVAATHNQLDYVDATPPMFSEGRAEQTLIWQESNGVVCRSRLDWLHHDYSAVDDFKTTSRSANPEQWSRSLFSFGGDVQAAFYLRGLRAVTGRDAAFRFCVQETFAPYALAVFQLGPDALTLAEAKVEYAIAKWAQCLQDDAWPAYPTEVCHVSMPPYEEMRWHEREMREAA